MRTNQPAAKGNFCSIDGHHRIATETEAGKNVSRHPWAAIASAEGTDLNDRGGVCFFRRVQTWIPRVQCSSPN
jgi:hypothetical protein